MTSEKDGALSLLERITSLLKSTNTPYRVIDHPPIEGTASGSSTVSGTQPEQGAKALIMMVGGEESIMVVVRGPDRVNYKAIKEITKTDNVRLASLEEVAKITLAEVGTLPPFGDLFGLKTYADRRLLAEGEIAFGTGLRTKTLVISTDDFQKIGNPIVGDFVKE
jgi:Ala-tRNA(Pro) deacylase